MYGDDHKIKSRYYIFPVVLVSIWLVRKLKEEKSESNKSKLLVSSVGVFFNRKF